MATITIDKGTFTLYFIESGGTGTGASPTDSAGTLPAPSSMSNNYFYILRRNSGHTWTIGTSNGLNSTADFQVGIMGMPISSQPFYDLITASSISADANLSTWTTEVPTQRAQVTESGSDSIEWTGNSNYVNMQNIDLYRDSAHADDSIYRFQIQGGTSESTRSYLILSNVNFLQEGYDMDNTAGNPIDSAGKERSGLQLQDLNMLVMQDVEIQAPVDQSTSSGVYSGFDYVCRIDDVVNSFINNLTLKYNTISTTSGRPYGFYFFNDSIIEHMYINNLSVFLDYWGGYSGTTGYSLSPITIQSTSSADKNNINIENVSFKLRKIDNATNTNSLSIGNSNFISIDPSIYKNFLFDMRTFIHLSDSATEKDLSLSGLNSFLGGDLIEISVIQNDDRLPSEITHIEGYVPDGFENPSFQAVSISVGGLAMVQDISAWSYNTTSTNTSTGALVIQGNETDAKGPRAKNIYSRGGVSVSQMGTCDISLLEIPLNTSALYNNEGNVYVRKIVAETGAWSSDIITNNLGSVFVDDVNVDVENIISTGSNQDNEIYVNSSGVGNTWIARSSSYKGISSSVTRTGGGTFSLRFSAENASNLGKVWIAPPPFDGLQTPVSQTGWHELIAYGSTVNYGGEFDPYKHIFFVEVPLLNGTKRSYNSFANGAWTVDNSTWSDPAVEGANGQKWKLRMLFNVEDASQDVGLRFVFNEYIATSYFYLDTDFTINPL
jgi:hypothetical protein